MTFCRPPFNFIIIDRSNSPVKLLKPSADIENQIFSGIKSPEKSFQPNFDIRFCLNLIKIFENAEDAFILMPILPDSGQKYEKQLKLPGTNLLRGNKFPTNKQILRTASNKISLIEKKTYDKSEKVLSQETFLKTGLWTIQFTNKKGRYSRIHNCHLWRDVETGTIDAFLMKKQFIFQDIDDFDFEDLVSGKINRAHALVSLNELLKTQEGESLNLRQLYQGNKRIDDLSELSKSYDNLFEMDENDNFILKESKFTPTLKTFLNYERKIIKKEDSNLENIHNKKEELIREAKIKIGELFEKLMADILKLEINQENRSYRFNKENDLEKINTDYPEDFQKWAKNYIKEHHALVIKPDFILKNGDFIEIKRGKALNSPDNKRQAYRMLLYKILTEEQTDIQIISLHPLEKQKLVDGIEYRYFFDTTWTNDLEKSKLDEIQKWENKISKFEK